jgi:hypothetical protein
VRVCGVLVVVFGAPGYLFMYIKTAFLLKSKIPNDFIYISKEGPPKKIHSQRMHSQRTYSQRTCRDAGIVH